MVSDPLFLKDIVFTACALTSVISAALVVSRTRSASAVMFMLPLIIALSGVFLLLNTPFISAVDVIVYGGVMIASLVAVMIMRLKPNDTPIKNRPAYTLLCAVAAGLFLAAMVLLCVTGTQIPDYARRYFKPRLELIAETTAADNDTLGIELEKKRALEAKRDALAANDDNARAAVESEIAAADKRIRDIQDRIDADSRLILSDDDIRSVYHQPPTAPPLPAYTRGMMPWPPQSRYAFNIRSDYARHIRRYESLSEQDKSGADGKRLNAVIQREKKTILSQQRTLASINGEAIDDPYLRRRRFGTLAGVSDSLTARYLLPLQMLGILFVAGIIGVLSVFRVPAGTQADHA